MDLEKELKEVRKSIEDDLKTADKVVESGFEAFYTYRDTSKMDTNKLLELLKSKGLTEAIEIVEVPKVDTVDDLVFAQKLTVEEVAECIIEGQQKVFNVIQTKKSEEE